MSESRGDGPSATSDAEGPTTKPIRVLIGGDTFAPDVNGAARFTERLAAGLVERGHEVHVVAPSASRRHGTWVEVHEGQPMMMHRLRSYRWYPHDWLRFVPPWTIRKSSARVLETVKPDVVHFQSPIIIGQGLSIEGQKRGLRLIGTNHLMPENLIEFSLIPKRLRDWATTLAWRAARRVYKRAAVVTTPTRKAAEFLEDHAGISGVLAISCGIDAHKYTPSFEPQQHKRILFVGRVTGEKQIDVLLKALTLLSDDVDATLDIAGDGDQRHHLEHLAETLGVADRVVFHGYVSDEDLREMYTRATVLAMPSVAELQSIVTMEAMASALPVVAANAMALPHLVHDGENGYLFDPGDARQLADRLTRILAMPQDELDTFKRESLRLIAAHDIQRTLTTFEKLYRGEPVTDPVSDSTSATADE